MTFDSGTLQWLSPQCGRTWFCYSNTVLRKIMNKLIRDGRVIRGFIGITAKEPTFALQIPILNRSKDYVSSALRPIVLLIKRE